MITGVGHGQPSGRPAAAPAVLPPVLAEATGRRESRPLATRDSAAVGGAGHSEWPITTLLALYPLWWALGLADWMLMILAVPIALALRRWSGSRSCSVQLPAGFGIWLIFLLVMLAGAAMLTLRAPDR